MPTIIVIYLSVGNFFCRNRFKFLENNLEPTRKGLFILFLIYVSVDNFYKKYLYDFSP